MNPRPVENRGEDDAKRLGTLQCGHDPKAVENTILRQFGSSRMQLQCGHDPKAVENAVVFHRIMSQEAAASMRPRPEGRGEHRTASRRRQSRSKLQCGHDPKAVENRASAWTSWPTRSSFNAATTRRPWRTDPAGLPCRAAPRLQCGHDPKAVENGSQGQVSLLGKCGHASMRPRPVGRGERHIAVWPRRSVSVTASMRPRPEGRGERRSWLDWKGDAAQLQCGHDPKAVENAPLPTAVQQRKLLQCGHDP